MYSLPVKHTHTHTLTLSTALSLAPVRALLMFLHPLDVAQQLKAVPHLTEVREEAGQMQGARKGVRLKGLSQKPFIHRTPVILPYCCFCTELNSVSHEPKRCDV